MKDRCIRLIALVWVALAAGCSTLPGADSPATPPAPSVTAGAYTLSVGDRVRVTVFGHEDLSGEFVLDGDGNLALPLTGSIRAAGLDARELEARIRDRLQPDYLVDPQVSVEVQDVRPVYVIGEVNAPGSYPVNDALTVAKAVALAGGFTYRAAKGRINIVRRMSDEQVEKFRATLDTPVRSGDLINVPERFF